VKTIISKHHIDLLFDSCTTSYSLWSRCSGCNYASFCAASDKQGSLAPESLSANWADDVGGRQITDTGVEDSGDDSLGWFEASRGNSAADGHALPCSSVSILSSEETGLVGFPVGGGNWKTGNFFIRADLSNEPLLPPGAPLPRWMIPNAAGLKKRYFWAFFNDRQLRKLNPSIKISSLLKHDARTKYVRNRAKP